MYTVAEATKAIESGDLPRPTSSWLPSQRWVAIVALSASDIADCAESTDTVAAAR